MYIIIYEHQHISIHIRPMHTNAQIEIIVILRINLVKFLYEVLSRLLIHKICIQKAIR